MLHYHIRTSSTWFHYPEIVTGLDELSYKELVHLGQFTYDLFILTKKGSPRYAPHVVGCPIQLWTQFEIVFTDGTRIERRECEKDCIERLDGLDSGQFIEHGQWPVDLRDIIYER